MHYLLVFIIIIPVACGDRKFPKNFIFGASSSAYQYEGAWNEDGRGPSIWDNAVHKKPSRILDGSTGDVACDSYHRYKEDVELMSYLGLESYRFSFSWSRILPTGFANNINRAGVDYYHNFIDELIKHDITPFATIYHWDLPEKLQELGGWANPNIVDWFEDYAKVVYDNFGSKIKLWTTINEPMTTCSYGYGIGVLAPFVKSPGVGEYMCVKNMLLAHARSYHLYHRDYNKDKTGKVGIVVNTSWSAPLTSSPDDQQAVSDVLQFTLGIIAHPIFSDSGDFPEVVKRRIDSKSAKQGFPRSRLPKLTEQEIEYIRGSADYLGVNTYITNLVFTNAFVKNMYSEPNILDDAGVGLIRTRLIENCTNPKYFYRLLLKIKELYSNPTVYITENGWSSFGGLMDDDRIRYLAGHISATLAAVDQGCDIRGYSVWSLLDNFEWIFGYQKRKYGLYEVDFSSPNLTRTPRKSAHFYRSIIASRSIDLYNITYL